MADHDEETETPNLSRRSSLYEESEILSPLLPSLDPWQPKNSKQRFNLKNHLTYYRVHLLYIVVICLIGSILVRFNPKRNSAKISYIDALYNAVSATTVTGLVSVDPQSFSTSDGIVLMILMLLGSQIFTSLIPLYVRRYVFRRHVKELEEEYGQFLAEQGIDLSPNLDDQQGNSKQGIDLSHQLENSEQGIDFSPNSNIPQRNSEQGIDFLASCNIEQRNSEQGLDFAPNFKDQNQNSKMISISEHGPLLDPQNSEPQKPVEVKKPRFRVKYIAEPETIFTKILRKIWGRILLKKSKHPIRDYIQRQGTVGDESIPAQKLYLEHDAAVLLARVVLLYFISVQFVGFLAILICISLSRDNVSALRKKNLGKALFSSFTAISMFSNSGLSLANENLVLVRRNWVLLLWLCVLILVGNTLFAPCLRGIILILHHYSKGKTKLIYQYLLQHPRKSFAHLFPRGQTIWLVFTVMAFNAVESICFFMLDWNSVALEGEPPHRKLVLGIFQSISTRNCGANVMDLGKLSPSMLILYLGLMYVAVYPVFLSRQNTRIKEKAQNSPKNKTQYGQMLMQSRKLIARDSAYLFIAVFLISLCENKKIESDRLNFSIFNIVFEVISGYGNVGLSVGYSCELNYSSDQCSDVPWSLSGKFNVLGKLVMIMVMVLGRHRGLPENIDVAVRIPDRPSADPAAIARARSSYHRSRTFT